MKVGIQNKTKFQLLGLNITKNEEQLKGCT